MFRLLYSVRLNGLWVRNDTYEFEIEGVGLEGNPALETVEDFLRREGEKTETELMAIQLVEIVVEEQVRVVKTYDVVR